MKNFWNSLPKPFSVLAPMEDVTDIVFRKIIHDIASPDVYFTEFVNCEGLLSIGKDAIIHRLKNDGNLKTNIPIVAQIWGLKPENFYEVAKMCTKMGFNGIDINMGCPQRNVTKTGACSALIKNPNLAKEIIIATKEGAKEIPVSVKTRIGYNKIIIPEWIGFLLNQNLDALTVHLRTVKEMSSVEAHWDEISGIVKLRDIIAQNTKIIGNGDLINYSDIINKFKSYNIDGGMIGRGIFKNIYAFEKNINNNIIKTNDDTILRLETCKKHILLFKKTWGNSKKYDLLKKYFKIYISEFETSKELRNTLMNTKSIQDAINILDCEISKKSKLSK